MAEKTSYIRIDRNIKNWRWWKDHKTLVVFLTLLIDANITEHGFSGQNIRRGQVVTSLPTICNSTGLTIREVRTAISHLKSTGEVTDKIFPKYRVITIVNYNKYQDLTGKTTYRKTGKRQANDRQATALRECREGENGENNIYSRSAPIPNSIEEIDPETDFEDFPDFDQMPCEADGTKRDIPPRVRKLFNGDYRAYWRYRQQCSTK